MGYENEIHRHNKMSEAHGHLARNAALLGHIAGVEHHLERAKHHAAEAADKEWLDWEAENNALPRDYYDNYEKYTDPDNTNYEY